MKKSLMAWAVSVLVGAVVLPQAYACSCFAPTEKTFSDFDHIFVGTVTAKYARADLGVHGIVGNWFDVERRFRGAADDVIEISALADSNFCGYHYAVGETYLVFAHSFEAASHSGLCRSFPVRSEQAEAILLHLGDAQ